MKSALFKLVTIFTFISLITGCISREYINAQKVLTHEDIQPYVEVGQHVNILTRDGAEHSFIVRKITQEQLIGNNDQINFKDIKQLERRELEVGKTLGLTVVIVTATLAVGVVYLLVAA